MAARWHRMLRRILYQPGECMTNQPQNRALNTDVIATVSFTVPHFGAWNTKPRFL
jgi:hypothetical protein